MLDPDKDSKEKDLEEIENLFLESEEKEKDEESTKKDRFELYHAVSIMGIKPSQFRQARKGKVDEVFYDFFAEYNLIVLFSVR